MRLLFISLSLVLCLGWTAVSQAAPFRIVAFGDSLTQGYGLPATQSYPTQLQTALREMGYDVVVINRGVSGDTTADGLARFPYLFVEKEQPGLVLLALGANDMFRRFELDQTETNLRQMLQILKDKNIPVILIGMKAVYHYSPLYKWRFNRIYPRLADEFDAPLIPFFLEGVAMDSSMNQVDGIHPNEYGVTKMVDHTLPVITETLDSLSD